MNTLEVEAHSGEYQFNIQTTMNLGPTDTSNSTSGSVTGSFTGSHGTISSNGGSFTNGSGAIYGGGGTIYSGSGSVTGSISSTNNNFYNYHVSIPYTFKDTWQASDDSMDSYYRVLFRYMDVGYVNCSEGTVSNVCIYDKNHNLLFSGAYPYNNCIFYAKATDLHNRIDGLDYGLNFSFILEFDWSLQNATAVEKSVTFTSGLYDIYLNKISAEEYGNNQTSVTDVQANESLNNIESSNQAIEESVTSDSGGGLLATIKNFFGSFFSNIINSFISLFVPDSSFFSDWFSRVNTLLSEKLGMLYAPFDLIISVLNAVYSADTTESGIPFPGISWDGTYIVEPFTFYFSSLGDGFSDLREAVYFGTDAVFLFAFLYLLQKKIALVITGSEVNG